MQTPGRAEPGCSGQLVGVGWPRDPSWSNSSSRERPGTGPRLHLTAPLESRPTLAFSLASPPEGITTSPPGGPGSLPVRTHRASAGHTPDHGGLESPSRAAGCCLGLCILKQEPHSWQVSWETCLTPVEQGPSWIQGLAEGLSPRLGNRLKCGRGQVLRGGLSGLDADGIQSADPHSERSLGSCRPHANPAMGLLGAVAAWMHLDNKTCYGKHAAPAWEAGGHDGLCHRDGPWSPLHLQVCRWVFTEFPGSVESHGRGTDVRAQILGSWHRAQTRSGFFLQLQRL